MGPARYEAEQRASRSINGAKDPKPILRSGMKGITWNRRTGKWIAQINIWLGEFHDIEDAKRAYDESVRKYRKRP